MTKTFNKAELSKFNGENKSPIYISVKGVVYDCSSGTDFYGPGKSYAVFAGKEVTRCLAKMMVGETEADAGWDNLSKEHLQTLEQWIDKFTDRYPVVGKYNPDNDFQRRGKDLPP